MVLVPKSPENLTHADQYWDILKKVPEFLYLTGFQYLFYQTNTSYSKYEYIGSDVLKQAEYSLSIQRGDMVTTLVCRGGSYSKSCHDGHKYSLFEILIVTNWASSFYLRSQILLL